MAEPGDSAMVEETRGFLLFPPENNTYCTPQFRALGFQWQAFAFCSSPTGTAKFSACVQASPEALQSQRDVDFSVTQVSHYDAEYSITRGRGPDSLLRGAKPDVEFGACSDFEQPGRGNLDGHQLGTGGAAPPAQCMDGDTLLALDDRSTLMAVSAYLRTVSPVFREALCCSSRQEAAGLAQDAKFSLAGPAKRHRPMLRLPLPRLPLPGTSPKQGLLHCLYAWDRKAWVHSLDPPELLDLGMLAHKFNCAAVLQLVDHGLAEWCNPQGIQASKGRLWLNAANAPLNHCVADELGLTAFGLRVGQFLGEKCDHISLSKVADPRIAAVLKGARLAVDKAKKGSA